MKKRFYIIPFLMLMGCGHQTSETTKKSTTIESINPCTNYDGLTFENLTNKEGVHWKADQKEKEQITLSQPMYYEGTLYFGPVKHCYDNGGICYVGNFKDGLLNGKFAHYLEDGCIWIEGQYVNGKQDGEWRTFNKHHVVMVIKVYSEGELTETIKF